MQIFLVSQARRAARPARGWGTAPKKSSAHRATLSDCLKNRQPTTPTRSPKLLKK
nr:MAG TPA: hypothetical protein [Caudoviricetes sp.]